MVGQVILLLLKTCFEMAMPLKRIADFHEKCLVRNMAWSQTLFVEQRQNSVIVLQSGQFFFLKKDQ